LANVWFSAFVAQVAGSFFNGCDPFWQRDCRRFSRSELGSDISCEFAIGA